MALGSSIRRVGAVAVLSVMLAAGAITPASAAERRLDRAELDRALAAVVEAGMPGSYAVVRDGHQSWRGAAGVADLETGRPVRTYLQHRVASVTKTFAATAVLQQVAAGKVELDAPISRYLPEVMPAERGQTITVRMLLNHTSGIGDFVGMLLGGTPDQVIERLRHLYPAQELIQIGLGQPVTSTPPGATFSYSNTNYYIVEQLLDKVTGQPAREYIKRHVIRAAGLWDTDFPGDISVIHGPHSKQYEDAHGYFTPPRDFSGESHRSWLGLAGGIVSTMDDLNRFYRALMGGRLLPAAQLAEMKTTVPAPRFGPEGRYGLGLTYKKFGSCGMFWGHNGGTLGAGTDAFISVDGQRQFAVGRNLTSTGPRPPGVPEHPRSSASKKFLDMAACGTPAAAE